MNVSNSSMRLSVPPRVFSPPRRLSEEELAVLHAVADALIPAVEDNPAGSQAPDFDSWLRRAIGARAEHFDELMAAVALVNGLTGVAMYEALKRLNDEEPAKFQLLSAVVAGAYLMVPHVRGLVGYPGQVRNIPRLEEAADQLSDGILDPVIERGSIFVEPGH